MRAGLALSIGVAAAPWAARAQSQPKAQGIESEGYRWNEMIGEKVKALALEGSVEDGEEAYEV